MRSQRANATGWGVGTESNIPAEPTPEGWAGQELVGTAGAPLPYQDGGDDERGVEEAVGYVGGEDPVVHAEPFRDVPVANLERETAQ